MTSEVLPGAETWSVEGTNSHGALVLHGFTGTPQSMRPLAEALNAAGFTVDLPLLPGHGTSVDDMLTTGWPDWSSAAEAAHEALANRVDKVLVVGLSMGGTLATWLATRHPVAGLAVINPYVEPPAESFLEIMEGIRDSGNPVIPAIGSDIALPGRTELAYDAAPVDPLISLMRALGTDVEPNLAKITCPTLILTSPQDHVVPPTSSDLLAARVSGPVERVSLDRSYHVATLDHDAAEIETRITDFALKVTASP